MLNGALPIMQSANGKAISATVKVGISGFTPPTIVAWDKRWLDGKVYTEGVRETTKKYMRRMRAAGADLVIAIFAQVKTAGPVVFHSAPGVIALARAAGLRNVSLLRADDGGAKGYALCAVELAQ